MKGLLFLSRVVFLCNLLFLICLAMRYRGDFIIIGDIKSTIAVLGWFIAPFLNLGVNLVYLVRLIRKLAMPGWIAWGNFIFLLIEVWFYIVR